MDPLGRLVVRAAGECYTPRATLDWVSEVGYRLLDGRQGCVRQQADSDVSHRSVIVSRIEAS
jgi:hypothetical protein